VSARETITTQRVDIVSAKNCTPNKIAAMLFPYLLAKATGLPGRTLAIASKTMSTGSQFTAQD
jgi:hypothetical protein